MVNLNLNSFPLRKNPHITSRTVRLRLCTVAAVAFALYFWRRNYGAIISLVQHYIGADFSKEVQKYTKSTVTALLSVAVTLLSAGWLHEAVSISSPRGAVRSAPSKAATTPVVGKVTIPIPAVTTPEAGSALSEQPRSLRQRTPSPYSANAPTTSPACMRRIQSQLDSAIDASFEAASPGGGLFTPPALDPYGRGQDTPDMYPEQSPTPFLSPPSPYQYQILSEGEELQHSLPKYHYSLSWSSAVSSSSVGALTPSMPRAIDDLLVRLQIDRNVLRIWAERLRFWVAQEVTSLLLQRLKAASKRAAGALQAVGNPGNVVVTQLVPHSGVWEQLQLPGDEDLQRGLLLLQQAAAQHTQQANNAAQLFRAAAAALNDYRQLCKVLRGDFPNKGILGNCPPGYLVSRIVAFASDHTCKAFTWNGGGLWQGRDWTRDLPTDTHVMMYLLAAFFTAPFWHFEAPGRLVQGAGGPLVTGSVPNGINDAYLAMLTSKPSKDLMRLMQAGLILLLGRADEPLLLLVLRGKPTITLTGEWACFEKVVLWLTYIKLQLEAKIGSYTLEYLKLDDVLDEVPVDTSVKQKRWFGIFA